jgi:thioredoxin-related protein
MRLTRHILYFLLFLLVLPVGVAARTDGADALDPYPEASIVFVEGEDSTGKVISRAPGVILKNGYVAVNYHMVAGMRTIKVYRQGDPMTYTADGYLSADEDKDLIILSVPILEGPACPVDGLVFPEKGQKVILAMSPANRKLAVAEGIISGAKDIAGVSLPQITSNGDQDYTNGLVFSQGALVGFLVAGYLDGKFYSFAVSAYDLRRLLTRSFIIKSFNSLRDGKPLTASFYQKELLEGLTSVLWMSIADAERLTAKRPKMILIDISTRWTGWGQTHKRNYHSKRIIRYMNEAFYAVKLDAETADTIFFNRLQYTRSPGSPFHTLAESLLEGQMVFPSTVFMDEKLNVLMVVPGSMEESRLEVALHYFGEKAYQVSKTSYQQFVKAYWERE